MSKEKNTPRKHPLLSIYILGPVLSIVFAFLFSEILMAFIGSVFEGLTGLGFMTTLFAIIGGLLALLIHKKWFAPEYKGSFAKFSFSDKSFLIPFAAGAVIDLISIIYCAVTSDVQAVIPSVALTFEAIMAGVCEETIARVFPVSLAMRNTKDKSRIVTAVLVSAIPFGLLHLINIFSGQDVFTSVVQAIYAAALGVFFGAVYLRTGNVLVTMIFHFLHDYAAFVINGNEDTSIMAAMTGRDAVEALVPVLLLMVCGIMLIRGHKDEIEEKWKGIWSQE